MKILEINIIQFGKFKDRAFNLDGGFNVIRGENESGKSTLLAFIKFALYGVGRKNPNIAVGERERAVSWNTGIAAGSLTLEDTDGKRYRIERAGREGARGSYADRARVIDLETGEEVFKNEVPGEHFLGINAQAYDSMCNIKQLECVALNGDAVKSVIDNLLSSGDENTNVQSAIKTLDTERRRLLHTNGKGGLVFESELTLEKLRSEHRGATVFENECVKNLDELERVELALAKAREEHELAQRMCDMHDDALRLQKFDRLRSLREKEKLLAQKARELENGAGFEVALASYERMAELKSASDALSRSATVFNTTKNEFDSAKVALDSVSFEDGDGLAELIDEFGSPKSAISYLSAKQKKKSNSSFLLTAFGIGGAVLLVFAGILAFAMNNSAGAMTVAFIGAVLTAVALVFYRQLTSAKAEISAFLSKLDEEFAFAGEEKILQHLEKFHECASAKTQRSNALEGARFRLSVAEDTLINDRKNARAVLSGIGISCREGDEEWEIAQISQKMKAYLAERSELDDSARESSALIRSLENELARFSESDIRARITPQIEEKIKSTSFEKLKAERDQALHRTNQYGQYKAGIERNLASGAQRRSSSEIFPEIEAQEEKLASLKLRYEAVKLAMETINSASLSLKSDITPKIRERAQENLSVMTAGKYGELYIDENMSLSVFADGATRPIDSLSRGSLDVAYFSVRLALLQTLLGDKNPPLYMDECLSQLDDRRAENTLRAITEHAKRGAQCLLFTCQNRDVELARALENTDVNVIEL